jgi:hypothetical protein
MDKIKSTKMTGFIAKLTNAANRAAMKNDEKKLQKRHLRTDFHAPMHMGRLEPNLRVSKLFEG